MYNLHMDLQNKKIYLSKYLVQSSAEEIANSISHGTGAILSLLGLILLIITSQTGKTNMTFPFIVYGLSLFFVYISSTLSHALVAEKPKRFFQVMDYVTIYLLIAGSYTPVLLGPLKGIVNDLFLYCIWGLAFLGVLLKVFFFGRFEAVSMIIYLVMGWIALLLFDAFIRTMPSEFLTLIFIGGLILTIGTIFYLTNNKRFHHFIWHLFVLVGTFSHFLAILLYT